MRPNERDKDKMTGKIVLYVIRVKLFLKQPLPLNRIAVWMGWTKSNWNRYSERQRWLERAYADCERITHMLHTPFFFISQPIFRQDCGGMYNYAIEYVFNVSSVVLHFYVYYRGVCAWVSVAGVGLLLLRFLSWKCWNVDTVVCVYRFFRPQPKAIL